MHGLTSFLSGESTHVLIFRVLNQDSYTKARDSSHQEVPLFRQNENPEDKKIRRVSFSLSVANGQCKEHAILYTSRHQRHCWSIGPLEAQVLEYRPIRGPCMIQYSATLWVGPVCE
jgi:hypothetical protein